MNIKHIIIPLILSGLLYYSCTSKAGQMYDAEVIRVIDGDTVELIINVGLGLYFRDTARLYGINAPETRGKERLAGIASKDALIDIVSRNNKVRIEVIKHRGKYGRKIIILFVNNVNINEWLVKYNFAKKVEY